MYTITPVPIGTPWSQIRKRENKNREQYMKIDTPVSHFTRQDLGFVKDQKSFEVLRAEKPLPLAPKAQQLVEHRGLVDPLATITPKKIDTYA
ncbi:MAG: hypothetical protein ACD_78C00153G0003 [uncultured bacterium (gcode 4)]|uniref:Uncharacterized protein n=1 Tax=uncultured bacterium (gcode 4) TaxID=1234023 RepID=K1XYA9_9BACT|nr:MAG: hypothetical protein ACD_78C00153G0003 [uncultured bacterium (gcode 4)]